MKMLSADISPQLKHGNQKNVSAYSIKSVRKYFVEYELKNMWSSKEDISVLICGWKKKGGAKVIKAFNENHPSEMEKKGLLQKTG